MITSLAARTGRPCRATAAPRRRGMDRRPARAPGLCPCSPDRDYLHRVRRLLQHLPGLGHPLGHVAHPDRRKPGAGGRGAAPPDPDRHRPLRAGSAGVARPTARA